MVKRLPYSLTPPKPLKLRSPRSYWVVVGLLIGTVFVSTGLGLLGRHSAAYTFSWVTTLTIVAGFCAWLALQVWRAARG